MLILKLATTPSGNCPLNIHFNRNTWNKALKNAASPLNQLKSAKFRDDSGAGFDLLANFLAEKPSHISWLFLVFVVVVFKFVHIRHEHTPTWYYSNSQAEKCQLIRPMVCTCPFNYGTSHKLQGKENRATTKSSS